MMSASGRVGGPTTHTFESEESPPPMPSSWRPLGSGEPITDTKIGSQSALSAGRSCRFNTTAFDVPPRMKVALILFCGIVTISALSGKGVAELLQELARLAEGLQTTVGDERIAINARHAHYLAEARVCLAGAIEKITNQGPAELLASDLRGALGALGEISGKVDNERMLDQLFASFCIGK